MKPNEHNAHMHQTDAEIRAIAARLSRRRKPTHTSRRALWVILVAIVVAVVWQCVAP